MKLFILSGPLFLDIQVACTNETHAQFNVSSYQAIADKLFRPFSVEGSPGTVDVRPAPACAAQSAPLGSAVTLLTAGQVSLFTILAKDAYGNPAAGKSVKEESELEEADFSKAQTTMAHTIGKYFKKKGVGIKKEDAEVLKDVIGRKEEFLNAIKARIK